MKGAIHVREVAEELKLLVMKNHTILQRPLGYVGQILLEGRSVEQVREVAGGQLFFRESQSMF